MFLSKRIGIYHLFYEDATGKRCSCSTKSRTKPEAMKFFREFDAEQQRLASALKPITIEAFTTEFLRFSAGIHTPKTVDANRTALKEFGRIVGADRAMHTIILPDIERFLATKVSEASAWTARKYHLALGAAFERALTWGHITENLWRKVKKPKAPEVLPAYFTREQFRALIDLIKDRNLRELVIVAALTGLRRGELLAMQWDWVDFKRRVITVQNTRGFQTKSKRARVVPMCDDVLTIMLTRRERRPEGCTQVFHWKSRPLSQDRVSRRLKVAIEKAGLSSALHFHSLRHTFASWLVQGGVSLYQVSKLMGHANTTTTEIYAHLVPVEMQEMINKLKVFG